MCPGLGGRLARLVMATSRHGPRGLRTELFPRPRRPTCSTISPSGQCPSKLQTQVRLGAWLAPY